MVDRIKETMKFQGHHVSPSELEGILLAHKDVLEVVVTSTPHSIDGDWPVAFVTKKSGSEVRLKNCLYFKICCKIKKLRKKYND